LAAWVSSASLSAAVATGAPPATASGQATTEASLLDREELTGDWGGARSEWEEKGLAIELSLTQFYQAVVDGGVETGSEYNGTAKVGIKLDLGKLWGWQLWSAEVVGKTRFGGPMLPGTGALNPVNTAAIIPAGDGEVASVTALNLTRLVPIDLEHGNLVAVSFGRFDLLDLIDEDFFAGSGTERFWNIAQIGPLTALRQVPLITYAASMAYVRNGQPFFTLAVMDPNDHSTQAGFDNLFADGATISSGLHLPARYFGKSAKHSIGGAITTKEYMPFDAIRQVILPGPPIREIEPEGGSWSLSYVFRQYLVERGPRDGWGLFVQASVADEATSPITRFLSFGVGGNGLFASRPRDEFGLAYAYTDLSDVLVENFDLLPRRGNLLQAERQIELFYDVHLAPWLQLTGDLQVIRPIRRDLDDAIVPGARLKVVF
jgi:porin